MFEASSCQLSYTPQHAFQLLERRKKMRPLPSMAYLTQTVSWRDLSPLKLITNVLFPIFGPASLSLSLLHPSLPPSSSSSCVSLLPPFQMGCPHPLRQKCVRRSSCVSLNSVYMCQSDVRRPWCTLKSHAPSPLVLLAHFSALQCCPVKPGTQTNSRELSFTDRSHSHTYSRR